MTDSKQVLPQDLAAADGSLTLTKEDLTIDPKDPNVKAQLTKLKKLIDVAERALDSAKDVMEALVERKDYKSMPGIEGKYDGKYITSADGSKHEVPSNYAAKSRLVYGDVLKIIEEEGKQVFKQIEKVARKNLEGVVTKKEGKWHVLTEAGSHVLLDRAVEFNEVKLNDLVEVIVPENNLSAPFAAFNKLVKSETPVAPKVEKKPEPRREADKRPSQSFKGTPSHNNRPQAPKKPTAKPRVEFKSNDSRPQDSRPAPKVDTAPRPVPTELPNTTAATDLDDLR